MYNSIYKSLNKPLERNDFQKEKVSEDNPESIHTQ